MGSSIFLNIVAPTVVGIVVGVVLQLFSKWLNKKDDNEE